MIILKWEHELISQKCTIAISKLALHLEANLVIPHLVITMRIFECLPKTGATGFQKTKIQTDKLLNSTI